MVWFRYHGIDGRTMAELFDPARHGSIVIEFESVPHDGYTYAHTDNGYSLRKGERTAGMWATFYAFVPLHLGAQVGMVRSDPYRQVTRDEYTGVVPHVGMTVREAKENGVLGAASAVVQEEATVTSAATGRRRTERPKREEGDVATAEKEKEAAVTPEPKEKKAADKPKAETKPKAAAKPAEPKKFKMGARAQRLIDGEQLGLTKAEKSTVLAKADALARERKDPKSMIRVWDVWDASGKTMPDNIAAEKEHFSIHGKNKGGGGGGERPARSGKADAGTREPATSESTSPEPDSSPTPTPEPPAEEPSQPESPPEPETDDTSGESETGNETL